MSIEPGEGGGGSSLEKDSGSSLEKEGTTGSSLEKEADKIKEETKEGSPYLERSPRKQSICDLLE